MKLSIAIVCVALTLSVGECFRAEPRAWIFIVNAITLGISADNIRLELRRRKRMAQFEADGTAWIASMQNRNAR